MLRDTRRSAAYFDELLPEFDEGIEETQQALDAGNFVLPDEQVDAAHQLYELAILRAVAHYSSGASPAELAPLVAEILPLRQQLSAVADRLPAGQQVYRQPFEVFGGQGKACGSANINRYIYALWWLGLLVATDADEAHLQQALACIGNTGRDALLDRIAARLGRPPETPAEELRYPALYRPCWPPSMPSPPHSRRCSGCSSISGMCSARRPTGTTTTCAIASSSTPTITSATGASRRCWSPGCWE